MFSADKRRLYRQMDEQRSRLAAQLSQELLVRYSFTVSATWLADFVSTVRLPAPPLSSLASTINFRLLNSDFTQSLSSEASIGAVTFPPDVGDVNTKHSHIQANIPVQVLDILDVGSSRWAQIEVIERVERGEEIRGREIVRSVPIMNEEDGSTATGVATTSSKKSVGPHRLLLQDAAGMKVWGFESVSVPRVFLTNVVDEGGLQIGAKVLLKKGTVVRRGLVMLDPASVTVLGGKVEEWDKKWRDERKQRLKDELKRTNDHSETGN